MAKDNKTGGRKKGTPNKKTIDLLERMGNFDPIENLIEIVKNKCTPLDLRVKINLDLLPYIYPKRKPLESTKDNESEVSTKELFLNSLRAL